MIPKLRLHQIPGYSPRPDDSPRPPLLRSSSGQAVCTPRDLHVGGDIIRRRSDSVDSTTPRSTCSSGQGTPRDDVPRISTPPSRGLQVFNLVSALKTSSPRSSMSDDHANFLLQLEFDGIMTKLYNSLHDDAAARSLHGFCDRHEAELGDDHPMLRAVYMTELRKTNSVTPVILRHVGALHRLVQYCEYCNAFWLDSLFEESAFLMPAYLQNIFVCGYYVEPVRRRWLANRVAQRYRDTQSPCALQALAAMFACGITCHIGSLYGRINALSVTYQSYVWYMIVSHTIQKACRRRKCPMIAARVNEYLHASVHQKTNN